MYIASKLTGWRTIGEKPARVTASDTVSRAKGKRMFGQATAIRGSSCSSGTFMMRKMPAWPTSTRNTVLSASVAVTVTVRTTS